MAEGMNSCICSDLFLARLLRSPSSCGAGVRASWRGSVVSEAGSCVACVRHVLKKLYCTSQCMFVFKNNLTLFSKTRINALHVCNSYLTCNVEVREGTCAFMKRETLHARLMTCSGLVFPSFIAYSGTVTFGVFRKKSARVLSAPFGKNRYKCVQRSGTFGKSRYKHVHSLCQKRLSANYLAEKKA